MKHSLLILLLACFTIECTNPDTMEDVIVIGGGLMGSSTAWELSTHGSRVLLLEQQDSVYTYGSSFGEARISRSLGVRNDIFSWLQQISVQQTKELINYLNVHSDQAHSMDEIYRTSPVTYVYTASQQREVDNMLYHQPDTFRYAPDRSSAKDLFGMKVPDTAIVIREYKKYSGTLNPKVLIAKLHEAIRSSGNEVRYGQKVVSLKKKPDFYEVTVENLTTGKQHILKTRQVVAAAGPYNGRLTREVAPYFESLITPKRLFLSFMRIRQPLFDSLTREQLNRIKESFPVAALDDDIFYSMIESWEADSVPLFKVGGHTLRSDIENLDEVWQKELSKSEIEWSQRRLAEYISMLNIPVSGEDLLYDHGYSCVYSLTDSEIPYVTYLVDTDGQVDRNFVLVGGMSGVGAKGSLAYGLMASNLLRQEENDSPLYQRAQQALGTERLKMDLARLNQNLE